MWCVAWRPCADPPQLASVGADRVIRSWTLKAGAALDSKDAWSLRHEVDASERHGRTLRNIVWSSNGQVAGISSFDATVSLWTDTRNGEGSLECVGIVKGHENEVKAADFSPSGEYFATCSRDKSVWIYETDDSNFEYECAALLQSHNQDVKFVRWHPSQDILFSCSYDDTIKVWGPDGDDWSCKETLQGHTSTVWCLSFDALGSRFASCSDDRSLKVWVPNDQATRQTEAAGAKFSAVSAAAFVSPLFRAAGTIKSGSLAPELVSDNIKPPEDASCQWTCVATIQGHTRPVYACHWLPFETPSHRAVIATACGDNHVRVFMQEDATSLSSWSCSADVEAHDGDANTVAWCPRQASTGVSLLASGGDDCKVTLWRFDE